MLKLSTSSVQAAAVKQPVGCSEEALVESINALSDASEALYSACADVEEVSTVLANLEMCAKGIKAGGLTKQTIAAFNSEGELSACVGQECLTVAGLESLGEDKVKELSATYSAGLEGKMAEYWNKFVAFLKNLWVKVKNWFGTLFQNRARWVKRLDGYQISQSLSFNKDKTLVSLDLGQIQAMVTLAGQIATKVDEFSRKTGTAESIPDDFAKFDEEAKKLMDVKPTEHKLSELAPSAANLSRARTLYKTQAMDKKIQNAATSIDKAMKLLIDEAGKAGSLEGEAATAKKEEVNKKRAAMDAALKACRIENSLIMKAGSALDKLLKAATTEDSKQTKVEPAKEEPKK